MIIKYILIVYTLLIQVTLFSQHLELSIDGSQLACPVSLRGSYAGYLPPNVNLTQHEPDFYDMRVSPRYCSLADSLLDEAYAPIIIAKRAWPCVHSQVHLSHGALILIEPDSVVGSLDGLQPYFEYQGDSFGPRYVLATSSECIDALANSQIIDSIIYRPSGSSLFSYSGFYPYRHVADDVSLRLPCSLDSAHNIALSLLPEYTADILIDRLNGANFITDWVSIGRGTAERRPIRVNAPIHSRDWRLSFSSGQSGDLINIKPRCTDVDSFDLYINIYSKPKIDSCTLQAPHEYSMIREQDTLKANWRPDGYTLTFPASYKPLEIIGYRGNVRSFPTRNLSRWRSYVVHDSFELRLVVASAQGCADLQYDFNSTVTGTEELLKASHNINGNNAKCQFLINSEDVSCTVHKGARIERLSDHPTAPLLLPSSIDAVYCTIGKQGKLVHTFKQ